MYVSEICAEGFFVTFPWWLKNVKSRSKIALFSNERHFEIWFPKKRAIRFFWSKLSKLHKKDPILHVATTFSLKQGETRTNYRPIPHPLNHLNRMFPCKVMAFRVSDFYIGLLEHCRISLSPWEDFNKKFKFEVNFFIDLLIQIIPNIFKE